MKPRNRRQPTLRFDLRTLDYDERNIAQDILGIKIVGTVPLYGYEKGLSSAPNFSNLSNRIPVINSSADIGVHEYAEPVPREYTRTGAYLYRHDKPNVASQESLLTGVPHAEDIDNVEALKSFSYRVFIDMKSGTVHAVVGSHDRSSLYFYRRYFSLLVAPITEMSSKDITTLAKESRKVLYGDGEAVCWLTRENLKVFLSSPRMPYQQDRKKKWTAEEKPITFVPLHDGVPTTISPHYMLAYYFRYGRFKESPVSK